MIKRSGNFPGKTHPIIQNARHFARENTQLRAPKRRQSRSELKRPDKTYAITPEPEKSTITGAQREIAKTDSGSHSLTNTWENQTKKGRGTYSLSLFHSYNRTLARRYIPKVSNRFLQRLIVVRALFIIFLQAIQHRLNLSLEDRIVGVGHHLLQLLYHHRFPRISSRISR